MDVHLSEHQPLPPRLLVLVAAAILFTSSSSSAQAATQPNANCRTKCGSVEIPFPFGTSESCALDSSFLIQCNKTSSSSSNSSHTPFLPQTYYYTSSPADRFQPRSDYNMSVLSISLNGELRVSWPVVSECYANGRVINTTRPNAIEIQIPFNVSTSRNKLTAVGCDAVGRAAGWHSNSSLKRYPVGCLSFCNKYDDFAANGSSCPPGCCEAKLQGQGLSDFAYVITTLSNYSDVSGFSPCSHAFVVEDGAYRFKRKDLDKFEKKTFPVVLDWTVGNHTCQQAKKNGSSYACKADNSTCRNSTKGPGYLCSCSTGFRGNPYLLHGCRVESLLALFPPPLALFSPPRQSK